MNSTKQSTKQAVLDAIPAGTKMTSAEIAAALGRGRSTVGKALAELEKAGRVTRDIGARQGARRASDSWSLATERGSSSRKGADARERLRPGQLDDLVLDYLRNRVAEGPLGPAAVAKGLSRSSGAVANCLARLAAAGQVRETRQSPRRYSPAAGSRRPRSPSRKTG